MYTIIFVIDYAGHHAIGYNLSRGNLNYAPRGPIHIARFTTAFNPKNGLGYLGDIYMRAFIRKWRDKVMRKKKRRIEIMNCVLCLSDKNNDLVRYICDFL
jgi:hypothetical protein